MKLYRGPASKDFSDDTHERVATHDFSKDRTPWDRELRVRLNASKDPIERRSVAHVVLEQDDVLALHEGLMAGLVGKAKQAEALNMKNVQLRAVLLSIQRKLEQANPDEHHKLVADLTEIVGKALGKGSRVKK